MTEAGRRAFGLAAAALLAAAPDAARAQADTAVATAVRALTDAMVAVDRAKLEALTSERLSYGHSAGKIETRAQFIANLESRANAFRGVSIGDQTIELAGEEAIVRHLFTGETVTPAGVVSPVRIGVLQVWRNEGGAWKLLARQAYRI